MQITTLSGGRGWLRAPAAASLRRLDLTRGRLVRVNSAGRSYAQQAELYAKFLAGTGSLALSPDAPSVHQLGMACDFHDTEFDFVHSVGPHHGWRFAIRGEPWHGEYSADRDEHAGEGGDEHWDDDEEEEDDMRIFITESSAAVKFELLHGVKRSVSTSEWAALRALEKEGMPMTVAIVPHSVIQGIPGQ